MADDPLPKIEKILSDVDRALRRRLATLPIDEPDHIILVIAPDGAGVVRSNCPPEGLRAMAAALTEIADQAEAEGRGKPN